MTTPAYINETKAAYYLGLAPTTFSRWRAAKKGPEFRKFSRSVRYAVVDLEAFAAGALVKS